MGKRVILIKGMEENNKIKSKSQFGFLLMLLLSMIISLNLISALFTSSNPQTAPGTVTTSSFSNSLCTQGQDFVVQISPTGCTPVIVRSDLLEEQDVKVYCPLVATQINPLIDIKSIDSISFSGNYSEYVRSIGFHPAQAALSLKGQQDAYPLLSNVGYVVIDLKQIPNESAMPDFVKGNLTAKINYDADKVFGVGDVNYYLPELSDSNWESDYPEYGFWNDKGYLRLDNLEDGKATITVYDSTLNEIGTTVLSQGEKSNAFPISGFGFCSGGAEIKLNAVKNAGTRVKLDVNGDLVEASKGEKFLENNCQVIDIQQQGLTRSVKITCSTDARAKTFDLKIAPELSLQVKGENRTVSLGDYLYTYPGDYSLTNIHGGKSVFLGYIGSTSVKPDLETLVLVFVAIPRTAIQNQNKLSNEELSSIAGWVQRKKLDWKAGTSGFINILRESGEFFVSGFESLIRNVVSGDSFSVLPYDSELHTQILNLGLALDANVAQSIEIIGFAKGQDAVLSSQADNYYESALSDYDAVLENYNSETYPSDSKTTLGEQAFYEKIQLAKQLNQKFTLPVLCDEFRAKYPESKLDKEGVCKDVTLLSSPPASTQYVSINGQDYVIGLRDVYQPTYEDYGAAITVQYPNGSIAPFTLVQDQSVIINETSKEFMQLKDLTTTTASVVGSVKAFTSSRANLKLGEPGVFGDYVLTLEEVSLKQFAQVSVIPKTSTIGSSADFSFNIGIEKRLIQLNPEKTREKLDKVNAFVETVEPILNTTETIINGLNTACELTGAYLTVKNFVDNLAGGDAAARQIVMRNFWNDRCSELIKEGNYISQEQCFLNNSDAIDNDVAEFAEFRKEQNEGIKTLESQSLTNSPLGGSLVNTEEFMQDYSVQVQSSLDGLNLIQNPEKLDESITVFDAKRLLNYSNWKKNNFRVTDARDVELYATILNSDADESLKTLAAQKLYSTLKSIKSNSDREILQETLGTDTGLGGDNVMIGTFQVRNNVPITNPKTFGSSKYAAANPSLGISASSYVFAFKDSSNSITYLIIYGPDGVVIGTYSIGAGDKLTASTDNNNKVVPNPFNFFFKQYSEGSYKNNYKVPEVHYFETDPYKGMPAIVPIDVDEGWYAGLKQTIAFGNNIQTYDASSRLNSFYLCNVGENGVEEFNSGIGDDICQSMDLGSGSTYDVFPGISDETKVISLVNRAKTAVTDAARAYQSGVSRVLIDGRTFSVGTPAADVPSIQCQDFMSPKDCNLLFNVCDPVICPSSRCDFGGAYHVKDVQATGIVGSTLLCLPNAREGIVVPVCLSGIQTGMENLLSVEKAYADCLQEKLDTGKTTGICDEMNSIYICSFFWEQASPLANLVLPKITEFLSGQVAPRGGGEYLSIQNAFDTSKQSTDYLTNYYAGSPQAFKLSTLNIGSAFCQNFASFTVPSGAEILEQVTTSDSPPQYTGTFEEILLTTATVPPTSQYKVFYHIYAGQNEGVYYSVYLESSAGSSFYQDTSSILSIGSGYIPAGGYADETTDKSAASGYNRLCINVNGQVECGFQQVSSSFAVDYLQDQYLSTEVTKTDITKESDCKSGSANIYSLLNPNLQNAVSDVIDPELYNQGISRTCATDNPGLGTDIHAGAEGSRWVEVGYCDDEDIKCWLDTKGIKDILDSPDLAAYFSNGTTTTLGESALDEVKDNYFSILVTAGYLTDAQFLSNISKIKAEGNSAKKLTLISEIFDKAFYNNQKAYLFLLRGQAYGKLATSLVDVESLNKAPAATGSTAGTTGSGDQLTPGDTSGGPATSGGTTSGGLTEDQKTKLFRDCMERLKGTVGAVQACTDEVAVSASTGATGVVLNSANILKAMEYAKENSVVNRKCNCGNACAGYANSLVSAGEKYGEDPLLLLSIMMQESDCTVSAQSVTSSGVVIAYGLMQIYSWEECTYELGIKGPSDLMFPANSDNNIQCGAIILKKKFDMFADGEKYPSNQEKCQGFSATYNGWDAAIRGYNGFGCSNDLSIDVIDYVPEVNARYNALKSYLAGLVTPSAPDVLGTCVAVLDANHVPYSRKPIPEQPFADYKDDAQAICRKCELISGTSWANGAKCDASECEYLSTEVTEQYSMRCRFTAGTRGNFGGECEADFDINVLAYQERTLAGQPTAENQKDAKFTCEYCSNGLSAHGGSCSYEECKLLYSDEAAERFNMRCNFVPEGTTADTTTGTGTTSTSPSVEGRDAPIVVSDETVSEFISPSIEYRDGRPLWGNLKYRYFDGEWHWSQDGKEWILAGADRLPQRGDENRAFIIHLGNENTYSGGLNLLFERLITESSRLLKPSIHTDSASMSYDKIFTYRYKLNGVPHDVVYLRFSENRWEWRPSGDDSWFYGIRLGGMYYGEPVSLIEFLVNKNFFDGAKIILSQDYLGTSDTADLSEVSEEDKKDAQGVCGYCVNLFSLDNIYCSQGECEGNLRQEAKSKFGVGCNFVPFEGENNFVGGDCVADIQIAAEAEAQPETESSIVQTGLPKYNELKSLFEKYAEQNMPSVELTGLDKNSFKALLVAIAQQNNWGGQYGTDALMGYHTNQAVSWGAENQLSFVSQILKYALDYEDIPLGYKSGSNARYIVCRNIVSSIQSEQTSFERHARCVLSVYQTAEADREGVLRIGRNTAGIDYAEDVLDYWKEWTTYFNSQ